MKSGTSRLQSGAQVPDLAYQSHRSLLNNAADILFLVTGKDKAEALQAVVSGEFQPHHFPAQLIRPLQGSLRWLVDFDAASLL